MEALVLGRPGLERTRLHQMLTDAGHTVTICHDRDWGCVGMDGACPLDALTVDVAVAVAEPSGRFDAQGIACVHRARIPIVAIGAAADDPVRRYTSATADVVDETIVDVVCLAARDTSGHRRAIEERLAGHVGPDECVTVSVDRRADRIRVYLRTDAAGSRAAALAEQARAAVRAHDARVSVIDVTIADAAP